MLKIFKARLQQHVNRELADVQAGFRKGRDQIANIRWIIRKAREFQKNIYFCFIDYAKAFDCVDHIKLWKIQEMEIPGHLTCLLRNLYAVREATELNTEQWTGSKRSASRLSPCLFDLYAEHIMHNAGLVELQTGSRLSGKTSTTSDMEMIPL